MGECISLDGSRKVNDVLEKCDGKVDLIFVQLQIANYVQGHMKTLNCMISFYNKGKEKLS